MVCVIFWFCYEETQCIFKAKNLILIQPDTRDLHLRSADETLVHVVVALLRILGIDIYTIRLLRFPAVAEIRDDGSYRPLGKTS